MNINKIKCNSIKLKRFICSVIYVLSILVAPNCVFSQPAQFRFNHFTSEDGLAQNTVYGVTQDKYGFMWFSTKNGITKYDGYTTKNFKPSNLVKDKVVDISQSIVTDNDGNIVFGTGHGLYVMDINTDSLIQYVNFNIIDSSDIYVNNIFAIYPDKKFYWLGTGNGLIRYNKTNQEIKYFSGTDLIKGWDTKRCWVKSLEMDNQGNLFVSTQRGLIKLNTTDFSTEVYNSKSSGSLFVDNDYFTALKFDKNGRLWAGTLRKGVYCFDFKKDTNININFTGLTDSSEAFNEVKRMEFDLQDNLWIGMQYTGLVRINSATLSQQFIRSNTFSNYALSSDLISALYHDRNGIMWVGTYNNGVDRTNTAGTPFINIPFASGDSSCFKVKAVECFAEQDSTFIWVGTMQGLFRFNRKDYSCATFEEVTGGKIALPHHSIAGLEIDDKGNLWIGSRSEVLLKINTLNFEYKYYSPDTTDPVQLGFLDCRTLGKSPSGDIYVSYDTRILKYDSLSDKLHLIVDRDSAILKLSRIYMLSFDRNNNLYFCSDYFGFFKFNMLTAELNRMEVPTELNDNLSANAYIRQFTDGSYVITDSKGLYLLDRDLKYKGFYSEKEGLGEAKITTSQIDDYGRVWVATFNGLAVFNPESNSFRNYYIQDGLTDNEFRESKSLETLNGYLFFPTNKGFTFFDPSTIVVTKTQTDVFITGFKLFGKEQKFNTNLNNIGKISLPAGSSFFSISFASESYNTIHPAAYLYKLDGVDEDWILAENGQSIANYTNIEGGTYVFRIKSTAAGANEKQVKVEVGQFFYKQWWFRLMMLTSLIVSIFYFIRFREKQLLKVESAKTIDYFANSFYGKNSVDEILWDVCRNCISRLGFEDAVVYLVDEKRQVLVQKAAYGPKNPKDFEIVHPLEIPVGQGVVGNVAKTGNAEIIEDTTKDPRYIADDEMRLSELSVPIVYEGKVIGVIDSENSKKRFFTDEHLRLLNTIASICSTKIAKAIADQETHDRERLLLEIGKKVAETRLMALKAQMNPHFIFNSLNSIQECIVHQKIDDAQKYLVQFSKLLRMVIDHSEQNTIKLDDEVEFLKLYLNLESLRFGNSFEYSISIADDVDDEEIRLPSLIVQPFVENAIWHGLLHKEGKRTLSISFQLKDNDHIVFVVEDNGIGRTRAAEIKSTGLNVVNHESKGLKITQERIDLVKLQTQFKPEIIVDDLTDSNGIAIGTRVTVTLPIDMNNM